MDDERGFVFESTMQTMALRSLAINMCNKSHLISSGQAYFPGSLVPLHAKAFEKLIIFADSCYEDPHYPYGPCYDPLNFIELSSAEINNSDIGRSLTAFEQAANQYFSDPKDKTKYDSLKKRLCVVEKL